MRKRTLAAIFMLLVLLVSTGVVSADRLPGADQGGRPLTATLAGHGSGEALITLNPGQGLVCYNLDFSLDQDAGTATAAHIHSFPVRAGNIVVGFSGGAFGPFVTSECVSASRAVILAILQNPEDYYVNIHTPVYPAGAIQGTLSR